VDVKESIRPYGIQTHIGNSENIIHEVFAFQDNNFGILFNNPDNSGSIIYKYSDTYELLDSIEFFGIKYSRPSFDDQGNLILVGYNHQNYGQIVGSKISPDLKLLDYRVLNPLLPKNPGNKYNVKLVRLSNGNYVVAYTLEPTDNRYRTILCSAEDLFNGFVLNWQTIENHLYGQGIEELISSDDGGFYISGDHRSSEPKNYVAKYNSQGEKLWELVLELEWSTYQLSEFSNGVIFSDAYDNYLIDRQGNLMLEVQHAKIDAWHNTSNFIEKGGALFYISDLYNVDGKLVELRKTNLQLEELNSVIRGSWASNAGMDSKRFLIELSEGKMVSISHIQNPEGRGNYWLMLGFDEELKMEGE